MNKILLLLTLFLIAGNTLSKAQSEPGLGKFSTFAVLGSNYVSNTGITGVTGDVGMAAHGVHTDDGELLIKGTPFFGLPLAAEALQDAQAIYSYWANAPATPFTGESLKTSGRLPGVYRATGNVNLDGIVVLDGNGDVNAKFVFVIDGDLATPSPLPPAPGTGLLLQNGAQPKNIFWIVKGNVKLGSSTSFQGNIISRGNVLLEPSVNLIGRVASLEGGISLNTNNIFLPNIIIADLGITKTAEAGVYKIGDEVTYTIKVNNAGPGVASRVVVTEVVPAALAFVRVESASAGTYDPAREEWVIDELKLNEEAELKITFKILAAGDIRNKVVVSSNNPDPKPGNNEGEEPIVVPVVSADLSITKTASGAPYVVGGNVTYTIVAKNNGLYPAEGVVVNEVLPTKLDLVSHTVDKGSFDAATGLFTVGTLANGETATLVLTAKILGPGQLANTASVAGTTPDPALGNNSDTEVIDVNCQVPTLSLTGNDAVCAETNNLTYTLTPVYGATYAFALSGGLTEVSRTGNTITVNAGNASGKITATLTDLCGKTYTVEKEVTVTPKPATPSITGNSTVCANSTSITYTAQGADDLTYAWTATGDVQITAGSDAKTVTVSVGANGGSLSVTAANQCFTSDAAVININTKTAPAAPVAITGNAAVCVGTEVTYAVASIDGATAYTWAIPTDWSIVSGQGTNTIKVTVGATAGNVSVAASNTCGSSAATSLAVTVKDKPAKPVSISGAAAVCANAENLVYTIDAVTGAASYTWSLPNGWQIASGQGTTSITVTAGTAAGNITVVVNNSCGSSAAATLPVSINQVPTAPLAINGSASACVGSTQTYSVAAVTGATGYNWAVPTGWKIESGEDTNTITVTVGANAGTITVAAANSCGNSAATSMAVTTTAAPAAPGSIAGPASVCGNSGNLTYTIAAVNGATSYTWSLPAGWAITSGQSTNTVTVSAGTTSGNISVTANNSCGASAAASYNVTVNNVPQAPLAINGTNGSCPGATLTYSVDNVNNATGFTWNVPATWQIKSGQGTNTITVEVGSGSGQITVAGTNACGTGATASINVAPTAAPATPGSIDGSSAICVNSANVTYSIAVLTGADTYTWNVPSGWSIVSGQGTPSITVNTGATGGQVSVTAANSCGTSAASTLEVSIASPPAAPAAISDESSLCNGLKYSIAAVSGATSYTWAVPAGFTIVSGQGTTTISVKVDNPNATGEISVVANNGTCTGPSAKLQINKDVMAGDLKFPKAFSPNGDGKNDVWEIENLAKYGKNQVVIYNRWGSEVYSKANYQNDWNGNNLEPGTYFYSVKVTMCDGVDKVFTGYITIFR